MSPTPSPASVLRRLVALEDQFGASAARTKVELLRALGPAPLRTAAQVQRLHELLCFWRVYPDSAQVLRAVEKLLEAFSARADVQRFRARLVSSGIAGADIVYEFTYLTALWLARRWPARLAIEWRRVEDEGRLTRTLITLALPAEVPGLDEAPREGRAWLERLRGDGATGAEWLVGRVAALPAPALVRDRYYDELGVHCRLSAGPDTPSRTLARFAPSPIVFQSAPMRRQRPDLRETANVPPERVRGVTPREAEQLIELARGAMVTRQRDLDSFVWADPRDVRLVDCGEGLQFACIGSDPSRRFLLESMYGFLTLKNGVPIGYALATGLMQYAEVAYNVFETFRGGEAAHVYGRLLATVRWLLDAVELTIDPYQLGDGNDEGLDSGAWWFYYKLGFRPRARRAQALVARELARIAKSPEHRTSRRTLEQLVRDRLHLSLGPKPPGAIVEALRLDRIGLAVTAHVAARFGGDRERAARVCADEAAELTGIADWRRRLAPGERVAWTRWAPLVAVLPGVADWSRDDRRALAEVIRAKGGRHESDYVKKFDAHARLRQAVAALSRGSAIEGQRRGSAFRGVE
jgi:hypothetical protein